MQISDFCFIEILPQTLFFMISKGPVLTKILKCILYPNTFIFSGANSCKFWRNMQNTGFLKFKMCLLKSHHRSYSFYCLYIWGSMMYSKKKKKKKNKKNNPSQNAFFSGAKSCKIWRKLVKQRIFGLKGLYRNSCTEVISFLVIVKLEKIIENTHN